MLKKQIKENVSDKYGKCVPYLAGGFISSLCKFDGTVDGIIKNYISLDLKTFDEVNDKTETIRIMVSKYFYSNENPRVKVLIDAFEKGVPVACVYHAGAKGNWLQECYVNFSKNEDSDLPI